MRNEFGYPSAVPRALVALLLVGGVVACSDDPTGPDGDAEISQQQAAEVATAVTAAVGQTFSAALGQGGTAARIPVGAGLEGAASLPAAADEFSWDFDTSESCPITGSVAVSGGGTVNTTSGETGSSTSWDWQATADYDGCGVETEEGTFTLSSTSPLQFGGNGQLSSEGESYQGSFNWDYTGGFSWTKQGGPSGECDVDLAASLSFEGGTGSSAWSGSVQGTVCGHSVDRDWSTTIDVGS